MNKILTLILSALFAAPAFAVSATPVHIMIDPGHGGRDHGAVAGKHREADLTLKVSELLAKRLQRDKRFRVYLTRETDFAIPLMERAQRAKEKKVDLFLSIHVNSSPDKKAKGAEFYFQNQLPPDEESMYLAHKENASDSQETFTPLTYDFLDKNRYSPEVNSIVADLLDNDRVFKSSQLSKYLKMSWSGTRKSKANSVRQAPFFVLSQLRSPSTLVELGFITNEEDYAALTNPDVQERMAHDLYHGLVEWVKDSMDKTAAHL